jgi:hypothetical protein
MINFSKISVERFAFLQQPAKEKLTNGMIDDSVNSAGIDIYGTGFSQSQSDHIMRRLLH